MRTQGVLDHTGLHDRWTLQRKKYQNGKEIIQQMLQCCRFTTAQTGSSYETECYNSKKIFAKFLSNAKLITAEKENHKIPICPTDVCDNYREPIGKPHRRNFNHRATELQNEKTKRETRERRVQTANGLRLIAVLEAETFYHLRRLRYSRARRPTRFLWRKDHPSRRRAILHLNPMENRQVAVGKEFPNGERETEKFVKKTEKEIRTSNSIPAENRTTTTPPVFF